MFNILLNGVPTCLDIKELVKILPHRYPFLLVDKIVEVDVEQGRIVGQKNLTINEAFFQGHFPDLPIMPGVLILEALAQTGGVLLRLRTGSEKLAVLLNVEEAKFRRPARPGDVLHLDVTGLHFSSNGGRMRAEARLNGTGKVAVEAKFSYALVDKDQI
jgi:3-hydroxyacyl-[acyl-carrier-protein] dehydratase